MGSRVQIYYDTVATAIYYNVIRLNDGFIWDNVAQAYVASNTAGLTFTKTCIPATAIPVIGGWDITLPSGGMGLYQVALYTSNTAVSQPVMGQVVYLQSGGAADIINIK